jgi:hypothetical protein
MMVLANKQSDLQTSNQLIQRSAISEFGAPFLQSTIVPNWYVQPSLFSESSGSFSKVDQIPLRNLALQSALKEMGNDVRKSATRCTSLDSSTPSHNHFFIHQRI